MPILSDKILVTGHKGMLGGAVMARLGDRGVGAGLPDCDIANPAELSALVGGIHPAAILNCAAWTDVDGAELHPAEAARINADAVAHLGLLARELGSHVITVSTDYVFHGEGSDPFPEDAPDSAFGPHSVYGQTKLDGERRLLDAGGDWCIARTQWLYGAGGKNFIDTIATLAAQRDRLKVVDDQIGAPTWVEDLADALVLLLDRRATGVYHCVNSGYVSWHGVARHVVERLGLDCAVDPCPSEEFPRPATRPKNSRLSQAKFAALAGQPMRHWREALDQYLSAKVLAAPADRTQ